MKFIQNKLQFSSELIETLTTIKETASSRAADVSRTILRHLETETEAVDTSYNYYCISVTDACKLSFWKSDKVEALKEYKSLNVMEDPYNKENRKKYGLHANIAKAVRQMVGDDTFTPNTLEIFSNAFKAIQDEKSLTITLYSDAANITRAYNKDNYTENGDNNLWGSCMRYPERAERTGVFYESLGAKLLVLEDANKRILGRALVWNSVNLGNGEEVSYIDRIYTSDRLKGIFGKWAVENGIEYRQGNDSEAVNLPCLPDDAWVNYDLSEYEHRLPYVDTFRFYTDCGELTADSSESYDYILDAYESGLVVGLNAVYSYRDEKILQSEAEYFEQLDRDGELRCSGYCLDSDMVTTEAEERLPRGQVVKIGGKFYNEYTIGYCHYFGHHTAEETTKGEIYASFNGTTLRELEEVESRLIVTYGGISYVNNEQTRQAMQHQAQQKEREARKLRRALQLINVKTDALGVGI